MRLVVALALSLAVGLAVFASPYASGAPDGLNRVAADEGFASQAREQRSPVPGYAFPGVGDERLAKGLAGFAGTLGVFAVAFGAAHLLRRRAHADLAAG